MELWEILVPTLHKNGKPIRTRFHRVWDSKVRDISNGLTVMPAAKGQWISPEGKLFAERMIPVRIACTRDQIDQIIDMSIEYYDQEAIMAYKISTEVIVKERNKAP